MPATKFLLGAELAKARARDFCILICTAFAHAQLRAVMKQEHDARKEGPETLVRGF